jgi:hypothetical protein
MLMLGTVDLFLIEQPFKSNTVHLRLNRSP